MRISYLVTNKPVAVDFVSINISQDILALYMLLPATHYDVPTLSTNSS